MTREARIMAGIILLTVSNHPVRRVFPAHFFDGSQPSSLVCQILADNATLQLWLLWIARMGVVFADILIPAGLFLSMTSPTASRPNSLIALIYVGHRVSGGIGGNPRGWITPEPGVT